MTFRGKTLLKGELILSQRTKSQKKTKESKLAQRITVCLHADIHRILLPVDFLTPSTGEYVGLVQIRLVELIYSV